MQFGVFSVGDVTPDPTSGRVPAEHERIMAMVAIARKAEEVGLDVFATGEHHNPPFVPSSPTTLLGFLAAQTSRLILSTATALSVGSPQQVIDKTMTFREHFGDYQRQLFLIDHAGLPLDVVLDQLETLGGEVVPVLRKEMAARRAPGVPDGPTHEARLAASQTGQPTASSHPEVHSI